jgi:4-amino-4-deoxy-L-arabinose transferase-like glycosyltransferase
VRLSARSYPRRLWLIVVLQGLLMLCTTVLYPAFQNPDEAAHVDYVLAHRHRQWFDGTGQRPYQSGVLAAQALVPGTQFRTHIGGRVPLARAKRESFDQLGTAPANRPVPNQMTQHPPLYYGLAAGFSYLLPDFSHRRFDVQVAWLRLLSVLLLLPVPILVFGAARRLTGSTTVALVAAVLPLSVPSYLRAGASVNNDSLLLLSTSVVLALLVRVSLGELGRRVAVLLGLAWAAALLTKGFALALPPAIVLAYWVGASGAVGARLRQFWRPLVLAGVVGGVLGGWWWLRNLIVYGAIQPDGLGGLSDAARQQVFGRDGPGATEANLFENFFRLLGIRTWGSLGLIDVPSLSHVLLNGLAFVLVALVLLSLAAGVSPVRQRFESLRELNWRLDRTIALLLPVLLTLVLMYAGARPRYLHGHQLAGVQVRYLLPVMLGLLICVAATLRWLAGRYARWLPPLLLTGSLVFLAASAFTVLDVQMSGTGRTPGRRLSQGWHYVLGWAPAPNLLSTLLILLTGAVALAGVAGFWLAAARAARPANSSIPSLHR